MKKPPAADFLRHFRDRMGLNQTEMAKQLDISPSLVGMVENDQRKLPVEAEEKFQILYDHYREILSPINQDIPPCGHASDNLLQLHEEIESEKLYTDKLIGEIQASLTSIKKTYIMQVNYIASLNRVFAVKKEPTVWDEVINKSYIQALGSLNTCGLIMQERLQLKLERLQAEAAVIDRHFKIIGG